MKIKDHFLTQEIFEIKETETKGIYRTSPVPENLDKYYDSSDYISHHQDSGSLKEKLYKFLQGFNLKYKKNILTKELTAKDKVLDYGCGAGEFLKFIENDFQTYGFEPNESARNYASQKLSKTIILSKLDLIENESLDAITLWHVFEHIDNQEDILQIFHNKLKTNGLLIIAVPNPTSYDAQHYKEFWAAYDVPIHFWHFSKKAIEILFQRENMRLEKVLPMKFDSFYVSLLSEKYKTGKMNYFSAFFVGLRSNWKARRTNEYSSLIYVLKNK